MAAKKKGKGHKSRRTSKKGWTPAQRKGKRAAMLRRSHASGKSLISVVGKRYKVKGHKKSFVTYHRAKTAANKIKAAKRR